MTKKNRLIAAAVACIAAVILLTLFTGRQYLQFILSPKYLFFLLTATAAIILLARGKVSTPVRIVGLIILFAIFGIFLGIHPSPLCAITKSLERYRMSGFIPPAMIVMAAAMILLTVAGNKVYCGWICPLGSLQEIVFRLPVPLKKIKLSFFISNSIRLSLFILFIIYLISFGTNIYNLFNPFELFHWHADTYIIAVTTVVLLTSLIYYRPFCHFLCPAGLITWFFEQVSILRINKNKARCTYCEKCIKESPCCAIGAIINDQTITPDCYACGKCIESCPEEALSFSLKLK